MFNCLPDELVNYIFTLCIKDYNYLFNLHKNYQNLLLINKNYNNIIKTLLDLKFFQLKCIYINDFNLPSYILKIFKNKNIYNIPFIKFSDSFLGYSDCIDNIKEKDVKYPVMIGLDYYKRPFFTFKIKYFNIKTSKKIIKISILYQRYENYNNHWVLESYYADNFHNNIISMTHNLKIIKNLLQKKSVKYKHYLIYI